MKEKTKIQETINLQSLKEAENFGILETTSRTVHDLQFERKTSREKKKKKIEQIEIISQQIARIL